MLKRYFLTFAILCNYLGANAQSDWVVCGNFNFGLSYDFYKGFHKTGHIRYSGLKIYCGFAANGIYQKHLVVNYGPSLCIYTKSIGANLNPLMQDIQIDFTNSAGVGVCFGADLSYYKLYRTMDNGNYYNAMLNKENAFIFGSNFVLNNHGRNQINGSITGSFRSFTINYFNDGGDPFNFLPLADNFDRFWTGGLAVFVHTNSNYNSAEFGFNQFTGYKPLLFDACDLLGINSPDYNADKDSRVGSDGLSHNNYNTSTYYANIFLNRNLAVNVGWMGSLKVINYNTLNRTYFGLQEIIHTLLNYPLHPNDDDGKFYFGANYNNVANEKL